MKFASAPVTGDNMDELQTHASDLFRRIDGTRIRRKRCAHIRTAMEFSVNHK
jgi:hypothetical protein